MRRLFFLLLILVGSFTMTQHGFAETNAEPNVTVNILSPGSIKEYPGFETTIKAEIKNNTNLKIPKMMAYITMANTVKHWTVNLEDYGADQPVYIGEIKPNETKTVDLPIRLVYTDKYKLYVTASSDQESAVYSSDSIPVDIIGNTKIDPFIVGIVAIAVPFLLLLWLLAVTIRVRKRS
jgi:uncharacterized membrane protein